jgi:protein-S-isoprenylcysteine O-methyltransferase Ste14
MKTAPFDYRARFGIHALLYFCGFAFYWFRSFDFYWLPDTHESTWLVLTPQLERTGLSFTGATVTLLALAIFFAAAGAFLRTWGAAYLGARIVQSPDMHGNSVLADGPYRRSRNPLYLGTFLHTIALALLMSPYGAIFTVITIGLFQLRLIFVEEPFLAATLGQPYLDYCKRVPRILPSLTPRVPPSGRQPHWLQGVLGESYMIGVAVSFAVFGWRYNAFLLTKCVIISLGVSLVLRALAPKAQGPAQPQFE